MRFTKDDPDRHVLILVVLGMEFFAKSLLQNSISVVEKLVEILK